MSEHESEIQSTVAGIQAAEAALQEIRDRSFSGRHPELGRMINCPFCSTRHRENERKCTQKFATQNREGDPIQGELVPPEGLTHLTKKQIIGAAAFSKKRINPHSNRYAKARTNKFNAIARRRKKEKEDLTPPSE